MDTATKVIDDKLVERIRWRFEEAIEYLTEHHNEDRVRGVVWARDMFEQEVRVAASNAADGGAS